MCLQSVGKMLSMGYGFVQYQKAEAAQKALRQLQVRLLKFSPLLHPAELSANMSRLSGPFASTALWTIIS